MDLLKNKLNEIRAKIQGFLFSITGRLPDSYELPSPYDIPVHNQGDKNNCTSHALASMTEYYLSNKMKERVLVDIDDLWEKQKKFGTATEERGDSLFGPVVIATKYGVRFSAKKSGRCGTFFLNNKVEERDGITYISVSKIEFDEEINL